MGVWGIIVYTMTCGVWGYAGIKGFMYCCLSILSQEEKQAMLLATRAALSVANQRLGVLESANSQQHQTNMLLTKELKV